MIKLMWRKVKTFFHVFSSSLFPQPSYYHKITKAPIAFSLKYFVLLILILNLVFFTFAVVKLGPNKITDNLNSIINGLELVPDDLVVSIKKGHLFTNYNRPYFFWLDNNNSKKLLLAIDETASPDKINIYNTYILLTSREMAIKTEPYSSAPPQIWSLKNIENLFITKNEIKKAGAALLLFKNLFYPLSLVFVPIMFLILLLLSYLITFFYLFIISLIVYYTFKTYFHKNIHFKKTLQLSFHAATLPLILDYFFIIFQPSIPNNMHLKLSIPTPLAFLILLVVFVFAAVYEAYQDPNLKHTHHHHKLHSSH